MTGVLKTVFVAAMAAAVAGCASSARAPRFESNVRPVPIARLLSSPERFDGRDTVTVGFLVFHGRETVLYLSRDDAQVGIRPNGVGVDVVPGSEIAQKLSSLNGQYVMVFGRFRKPMRGTQMLTVGRLTDISAAIGSADWGREGEPPF